MKSVAAAQSTYWTTRRLLTAIVPSTLFIGGSSFLYVRRQSYLNDPLLKRGLAHLKKDQRVADFCGDNIKPGWMISKSYRGGENWV